jgi:hypothetical protein
MSFGFEILTAVTMKICIFWEFYILIFTGLQGFMFQKTVLFMLISGYATFEQNYHKTRIQIRCCDMHVFPVTDVPVLDIWSLVSLVLCLSELRLYFLRISYIYILISGTCNTFFDRQLTRSVLRKCTHHLI